MKEPDSESRPARPKGPEITDEQRRSMEAHEFAKPSDVELTEDHIEFFREAGASEAFCTFCRADPEDLEVDQPAVIYEAKRCVFFGEHERPTDEFSHRGGPFFRRIWEGDLYGAFQIADPLHASLMKSVFGEERINSSRPHPDAAKVSEMDPLRFLTCRGSIPPEETGSRDG